MVETPGLPALVAEAQAGLKLLAAASAGFISIRDERGACLGEFGVQAESLAPAKKISFHIEAEPVGTISVVAARPDEVAALAAEFLNDVYRRKLMAGMFEESVSGSFAELQAQNGKLKELAASLESQVRQRTRELDQAHARLAVEEKVAAVGRLAAGVAHELNTPLACVRSNLNALKDYVSKDGEALEIIAESAAMADRAAGIVRDLREFSHIDDLGLAEVGLNEECDRALARLVLPPGVRVQKAYAALPCVRVDGRRLSVALLNLLENARDAVAAGGTIVLKTEVAGQFVVASIRDNGTGIPPEVLARVFDPFFTTKDVGRGTGLGLTVTRGIVRAQGGDVTLECPRGGGTVARISLPVKTGDGPR